MMPLLKLLNKKLTNYINNKKAARIFLQFCVFIELKKLSKIYSLYGKISITSKKTTTQETPTLSMFFLSLSKKIAIIAKAILFVIHIPATNIPRIVDITNFCLDK